MKISYNWLKQYIDCEWSPKEMADRLTMCGLEVEGEETYESIPGGLAGVVVGEVKTCEQHPNADKLKVCTVDVGQEELLQIVCGAPNVAAGQKVPVGLVGTTLHPVEGDPFTLKKSKIRGELSFGMICAEDELGLGQGHDGILVLDDSLAAGTPAHEVFDVERDIVLEIGLTPNRVDAASHFGTARDIAALLRKEGKKAQLPEIPAISPDSPVVNPIAIELPEADRCPRYVGIFIEGVTIQESPSWLQDRLKAIGLRPINNVVDITNFVLHELGQPLHAFDADNIRGNKIVVRTLDQDAKFKTLDDTERDIRGGKDLMICDGEGPVAIGGIMGGLDSEVTNTTKNVFLESAYFTPSGIRQSASHFGLKTDASFRFERGTDPNMPLTAALRATALILELAGGTAATPLDVRKAQHPPLALRFDLNRANVLMGYEFPRAEVVGILKSLEIEVEDTDEEHLLDLRIPAYRVDVTRPQDVMEEILRIYGYNNVPLPSHTSLSLNLSQELDTNALRQRYFNALAADGFLEMVTNPLIPSSFAKNTTANLINNLSEEMAVLRDNMLYTGLNVIAYNQNRQNSDLRLVEFGKTYSHIGEEYGEQAWICLYLTGDASPLHWSGKAKPTTFFTLAREVERLQGSFGFSAQTREIEADHEFDYGLELHRGERVIVRYGKVADELAAKHDLKRDVFFAQIDWEELIRQYKKGKVEFQALPKFPALRRDISMIVPETTSFAAISAAIQSCNPKLIQEIDITDVYKGANIGEGKKSYLVNVVMQDANKTLNDKAADKTMKRVFAKLENDLGLEIRK